MNGSINDTSLNTPERRRGYVTFIILALLCILSICLNSLLIYCLVSNRKKTWARKAKQLLYLVLSDLFTGICLIPRTIFTRLDISVKTYEMCAILNYFVITPQVISFYHVLSLCVHRYMQIRKVQLPSQTDNYRYDIESCVIWIAAVLFCMPPFFFWGRHDEVLIECSFISQFGVSDRPAMIYALVVISLPCILTNVFYVAMVIKMIYTGRVNPVPVSQPNTICQQVTADANSTKLEQRRSRQTKTTPLLATQDHANIHENSVVLFSASHQRCNIVQQHSSHQSVAVDTGPTTVEEPQQPFNARHQQTATLEVALSTTARQVQPPLFVQKRNKRVVKGITLLLVAFNISILPLLLIPGMMLQGNGDGIPPQLQGLVFLNNVLNPIIYTFSFTNLRDEIKRTFRLAFSRLRGMTG